MEQGGWSREDGAGGMVWGDRRAGRRSRGDHGAGGMVWGGSRSRGRLLSGTVFCALVNGPPYSHLAACFSGHRNSSPSGACLLISFSSFTPFPPFFKSSKTDYFEYLLVVTFLFSCKNKSRKCQEGTPTPDRLLPVGLRKAKCSPSLP